jgi:hypothetical protein
MLLLVLPLLGNKRVIMNMMAMLFDCGWGSDIQRLESREFAVGII